MFDFSFSEIALIGVVALVVIGPERLPRVARTAGVVLGRVQRYAATVRADIAREVELSELRRVQTDIQDAARALEHGVRDSLATVEQHLDAGRQAVMTGPQATTEAGAGAAVALAEPTTAQPTVPVQPGLFAAHETPPGPTA